MNKKYLLALTIILILGGTAFLYFNYGIYRYDKLDQKTPVRINRFTGETWLLNDDGVWMNKDDIAKQHREEERSKQAAAEEELKKKDIPTVSMFPIDSSKSYLEEATNTVGVAYDKSINIENPHQHVVITWENSDIDTISISINGNKLEDDGLTPGLYGYDVTFNKGVNEIVLQTSRGTYKYYVNY